MLRQGIFLALTLLFFAHARASSSDELHFVPMKRFEQRDGLPPKLIAFFDIDCGDQLVDTVRFQQTDAQGVVHIYLAGLARANLVSSCVGETREVSKQAGFTYSGRNFRVQAIEGPMLAKVKGGFTPASGAGK